MNSPHRLSLEVSFFCFSHSLTRFGSTLNYLAVCSPEVCSAYFKTLSLKAILRYTSVWSPSLVSYGSNMCTLTGPSFIGSYCHLVAICGPGGNSGPGAYLLKSIVPPAAKGGQAVNRTQAVIRGFTVPELGGCST